MINELIIKKRELVLTERFKKSYKKFTIKNPKLKIKIDNVLEKMNNNIYEPSLLFHKLHGKLNQLYACSCAYDCRIIFDIVINPENSLEEILLIDIGNHELVY